ncbi:dynein axonemal heavy chain 6 isoform X2 [Halyomorpha halys]|uniref:dynein axonemal heavy chain 6 isoform X2 n=1 Tax=Halyomorpha halys TaxID=286706 RepID=UPI0006D4E198
MKSGINKQQLSNFREVYEDKKRLINSRFVTYPITTCFRQTNNIPFHIPHKRVYCDEVENIEKSTETIKKCLLPDIDTRRAGDKGVKTQESSKISGSSKTPSPEPDPDSIFGPILKLPPIKKVREKTAQGSGPRHRPLKGRLNFGMVLEVMKKDKSSAFYYLKPSFPKESLLYSPFDFMVVDYRECHPHNYYTLSRDGMMHHIKGVATFKSLEYLEMAYNKYNYMRNLFRQWKKYIGLLKVQSRVAELDEIFLFKREDLRNVIFDAKSLCFSLSRLSFFDDSVIEQLTLEEFYDRQLSKNEEIMNKLREAWFLLREMLKLACYSNFKSNGFSLEVKERQKSTRDTLQIMMSGISTMDVRPVYEHYRKKQECISISKTIRMVDYLVHFMLHSVLKNSIECLNATLKKHTGYLYEKFLDSPWELNEPLSKPRKTKPMYPMFLIDLQPNEDLTRLIFEPQSSEWITAFKSILELWTKSVESFEPFSDEDIYLPFIRPIIGGLQEPALIGTAPKLHNLLENDYILEALKEHVVLVISKNIQIVFHFIGRLQNFAIFYKMNVELEPENVRAERDVNKFRFWLRDYEDKLYKLNKLLSEQDIGLFFLTMNNFKKMCIPICQYMQSVLKTALPEITTDMLNYYMDMITNILNILQNEPKSAQNFVELMEVIRRHHSREENFEDTIQYVREVFNMTPEFGLDFLPENVIQTYMDICDNVVVIYKLADTLHDNERDIIIRFLKKVEDEETVLRDNVERIREEAEDPSFLSPKTDLIDIEIGLQDLLDRLQEQAQALNKCRECRKALKVAIERYEFLDEAMTQVKLKQRLWENVVQWDDIVHEWENANFETLNADEIQQTIGKYLKNLIQFEKNFPPNQIVPNLREKVEAMKDKLPVINNLLNPNVKRRHWLLLEKILNCKFLPDEVKTLKKLEELGMFNYPEVIADLSAQASSESALEGLLKKVEDAWKSLEFTVVPYKDAKDVYMLSALEEINTILDETHINLSTISSSRSVGPIKPKVDEWNEKVELFSKTLEEWTNCQTNWLYLEPIFSAPDIQRQLPNEAKMFLIVDKSYKNIMRNTYKNPAAMPACTIPGLFEELQKDNSLLEEILKCLEAYLECKRVIFPRFYFLSNEELIEILAQTRNPHAVQPFLNKCFDAMAKIEFCSKLLLSEGAEVINDTASFTSIPDSSEVIMTNDIRAMISSEGEKVKFVKRLKAQGNVEDWLGKVEDAMFISLYRLMKLSIDDFPTKKRTEWVLCHASQIILAVSQIMWARNVQLVLNPDNKDVLENVLHFEKKCFSDLNDLASLVRGNLKSVHRTTLGALITIDVHARDIISGLVQAKVDNSNSFDWVKQLRYYWDPVIDTCIACMASARHVYGFEYLGVTPRLVITPLTDKCYLCLMGALQLDLGGAPAGPAGTGKTETTKDLAKALAIQCVVFNCSEQIDYKMMGRFFSGLAQCGAWCCFDEFNRIDIEVLSVIAQQLITIRNAKAAKQSRFMFEGREIKLIPQCATFITMNPGYAGRTELPDNLKSVFRPFAMMVPDYALIAEVSLYSEGFESSRGLAQKMVNMYKLCSEQLSQQDHYDFGMRAVKSVLVMAGSLKRQNPTVREDIVLIRALRDSNLPKFLADDSVLFKGILNDLFPGVTLPEHDYGHFQKAMETVVKKRGLQPVQCTFTKTIQLYETMLVRHGVMTVGPTGGGKTTVLNVLKDTLGTLHQLKIEGPFYRPVLINTLNPKAVAMGELYGEVNLSTMEWKDGLLGIFVRKAVRCTEELHQWVVCDGPVDAVWIENMNTVLDDNKMLCLANSERIKLTPWVHMLFEVQDLAQASPATVSRCGMVYIDPNELRWMPFMLTWAEKLLAKGVIDESIFAMLTSTFEKYVDNAFHFVQKHCSVGIHQVEISKIAMLCSMMQSILKNPKLWTSRDDAEIRKVISETFLFTYVWAIGGNLVETSREAFSLFIKSQFEKVKDVKFPQAGSVWDMYYSVEQSMLRNWTSIMPHFKYNPEVRFFDMLVPTMDTVCFGFIMEMLLEENHPVFFTGTTGVGKSVIAKAVLDTMSAKGNWVVNILNFSAQTSSLRTQEMIELKMEKKKRTMLGAPFGKKLALFVDDVNMPKLETYGAQAPVELLRQFLDFKGLYDREKLFWKDYEGMVLCCACAPPGGGRNPLTPRYVRHFGMLYIPAPSTVALKIIFSSILKGFLADFSKSILEVADEMVNAAVVLYQKIAVDLLPTPAKSHYVFNLRDLSKCIQGVLQADGGTMREKNELFRLFFHECLRTFHDRLIDNKDKSYFWYLLRDICTRFLSDPVVTLPEGGGELQHPPLLLFGDFMNPTAEKKDRIYEEIRSVDKLKAVLQDTLVDYNLIKAQDVKLIFFTDAMEHICRLARILRAERGNGLLVGVGGMGKQSLTKLGSHLNLCNCFQIELTRTYDYNSFHEDLRKLYYNAGALNQDMVFLFTDTQIVVEEFLEDINNILNSGEVPNLFEGDDLEKCIIACRPYAKAAGINESNRDAIFTFFIQKVRMSLHVVLCMSPVGDAFRRRCRMFPSLVNCCTIDWFMPWPQEALLSVAEDSLRQCVDSKLVDKMSSTCYVMHSSVEAMTTRFYNEMKRYYYVTPSSYLDLLKLYQNMLESRKKHIIQTKDRINNGLLKLFETNDLVATMKIELAKIKPLIAKKNEETTKLVEKLVKEKAAADEVRTVVLADEALAKEKAGECQVLKDDAQADLDLALPAMDAAVKALEALNKNDINEVRVFLKPPYLVKFVMEAVCLLLGAKQDWASAKIVLGDGNFLKRLQDYDKDNIPDSLLKKLKKYIEDPQFVPELVASTSKACKSLCLWVRAIDKYSKIYRIVEPKRKKLQAAETELNSIMAILRAKQARLADVESQIARLEEIYDANLREKAKLEYTLELCSTRMNRAGRLTSALSDEQERWENGVKGLTNEFNNLVGDVLVAAACVAYLGAFTNNYREELSSLWLSEIKRLQIPASATFSLIQVLADAYEIRLWNTCGLPRDKVSTENGIYVTRASRWPLMIDPQEQANRWIRQMEADNNLKMVKMTDSNFMRVLESCIRLGLPMLIWEVGELLDPTLRPVLTKSIFYQAGRWLIRLGDTDVEYDRNFRLYVTTKLGNPHYLPEICIQVTLVNFTVTPSGLEDQLLGDVVRIERPDLERQRNELIVRINKDKTQLKAIEDKILKMLFASEGNILDDEELVETLNESKETSAVITARLEETEETEAKITIAREGYRLVAERGSVLYFVVAVLAEIDPMYQYSLKYFKMIFNNIIEITPPSSTLEERLNSLKNEITVAIYNNVSRGLFEKDKLVYSFMLCACILLKAQVIKESHWVFLLRGPVGTTKFLKHKPDLPNLSDMNWRCCLFLEELDPVFENFTSCVSELIHIEIGNFSQDIAYGGPDSKHSKIDWNHKLDLFNKLLVLKALKEEKVIFAITEYVKVMLGQAFVESPLISLHILFADTSNITPLVFVLSTGSDPVGAFLRFATETGNKERINSISLGQGQGPIAHKMIERGKRRGDWIFLQNCHLASSWMLSMEKIILEIQDNPLEVNNDFRLFLSSMPSKSFPVSVLQNSVKVTNEPPKGIRANLKRAFTEIHEDFFNDHPLGPKWRKMIFGICFFHAVILERKKFGPLGWNIMYEFSDSDRECALLNLNLFSPKETNGRVPWAALQYITGEITYGGRVTDFWDQRTLKTILKTFFSPIIFEPNYKYSESGTYYCPEGDKIFILLTYKDFIENLPLIEEPEIFGMHENANIAFQTKETGHILNTVMQVQIKQSAGVEGQSSDDIVFELADNIIHRITTKISTDKMFPNHTVLDNKGRVPSLTTVLVQEVDRFNKMLRSMHSSINDLKKAIKGFVVMSDALEEVYTAFMSNMVPKLWGKCSYPSLKTLGSWIRDLELRIDFIQMWVTAGSPSSFWISGFFFPQGFMTGVLQTYSRKYDFPIDELKIDFTVQNITLVQEEIYQYHQSTGKDTSEPYKQIAEPGDGIHVHGLFLDAARFDTESMLLADPFQGELNPPLPVLTLLPISMPPSKINRYECPLYKTSVRAGVLSTTGHSTNFVIAVLLPTDKDGSYWIMKGTALLTQITD